MTIASAAPLEWSWFIAADPNDDSICSTAWVIVVKYTKNRFLFNKKQYWKCTTRTLSAITLPNKNKVSPSRQKETSSIPYRLSKCGIRARVWSPTLAHGNSKNEIRQRNKEDKKKRVHIELNKYGGWDKQVQLGGLAGLLCLSMDQPSTWSLLPEAVDELPISNPTPIIHPMPDNYACILD